MSDNTLRRSLGLGLLVAMGFGLSACSTLSTSERAPENGAQLYAGTRLNVAAISGDQDELQKFKALGLTPVRYPAIDLPLSLVGDTLMLPLVFSYELTEPLLLRLSQADAENAAAG